MKKFLLIASLLFASFSGIASTDALGDFIQTLPPGLPTQQATVLPKTFPKNTPEYVKSLYNINEKQKKVLEYALMVGNKYDRKTGKLVEVDKTKRLGYHLAAIAWIESRACEVTGKGKKNHGAYGCWQVTTASANETFSKSYPKRTVIKKLETLHGGTECAIGELSYWLNYHNGDIKKALASYNKGFKYKDPRARQYAKMVMHTAKILEENQML